MYVEGMPDEVFRFHKRELDRMRSRPLMEVRKYGHYRDLPWFWFCRTCTATGSHSSWIQAMRVAEYHWNSHWVKGAAGPITLGDIR
jgi:hypothetical protein